MPTGKQRPTQLGPGLQSPHENPVCAHVRQRIVPVTQLQGSCLAHSPQFQRIAQSLQKGQLEKCRGADPGKHRLSLLGLSAPSKLFPSGSAAVVSHEEGKGNCVLGACWVPGSAPRELCAHWSISSLVSHSAAARCLETHVLVLSRLIWARSTSAPASALGQSEAESAFEL